MLPNVEINLGETLPFIWGKFLQLIGQDSESAELKEWFTCLQRVGFTEASSVQCIGMHGPLPLQEIFQPTKLLWQVPYITLADASGRRAEIELPREPVRPGDFFQVATSAAIFAGPGWGKTTFLHHMLISNVRSRKFIPILITLRRPSAIDDLTKLIGMLSQIKKLRRGLQILLLVDGYDEIATSSRKLVSECLLTFEAAGVGRYYVTCRDFEPLAKFPAAASALVARLISLDLGGKKSLRHR
ncbi:MAG: hypothetical protein ACYCOX_18755 [Acidobacteriaceae bacterium]